MATYVGKSVAVYKLTVHVQDQFNSTAKKETNSLTNFD